MTPRRPSKTGLRVLSIFGLLFMIPFTALAVLHVVSDVQGKDTAGEVIGVEHRGTKTFLTIRFTTDSGKECESSIGAQRSGHPVADIGDRVDIHYGAYYPCSEARGVDDQVWPFMLIAAVLLMVFVVMAYVAWRPPGRELPIRYAGMP